MRIQPTIDGNLVIQNILKTGLFKSAAATTEFHLYQNNLVPGPGTHAADFTDADFDGYAEVVSAAWTGPLIDPISLDWYTTPTGIVVWVDTGNTTPNTIYGWYMLDAPAGNLVACQRFDTPVVMDAASKTILIAPLIYNGGTIGPDAYED